ncbi:hypothetical protein NA57DRAFT_79623 [Rhizodiscina lignyota]|uniref:Wax synthase domain-containing protein n=1 Tax=Rhizodiscina lignyota TaxID=1504668 RepID=A0A9P4I927_9PEZI|nr:hypothetical protein NA57DRAFT_79623 [Rhizodiscina lignyota]
MDFMSSLYPPLSERRPFPAPYAATTFFLTLVPFLSSDRRLASLVILPVLLLLCAWAPFYTFGSPSDNYYSSGPFLAMPLWYFDFVIFTPVTGPDAPVFVGSGSAGAGSGNARPQSWTDVKSTLQRLRWAFRLMIPSHRGIGWNWQVKGVPPDPNARLPKWTYVRTHLQRVVLTYLRSVAMLVILGFGSTIQGEWHTSQAWVPAILNAVIGWSGAIWVWDRLNCFYSLAAAFVVYHQVMRRMVQQPAVRIAHILRLRKGSVGSRYTQLYASFAISCLFHQFEMFNVTRKDMGEFAFFMSQPVAITAEDIVQWAWRKWQGQNQSKARVRFGKAVGYIWVFLWFSYSLPIYIKGLRDADIIRDALLEAWPSAAIFVYIGPYSWPIVAPLDLDKTYESIAISDAKEFHEDEYDDWAYYVSKEKQLSAWDLYYVLLVENSEQNENIWYRVGLGKIFKEAFNNSCGPDRKKQWKELILG